MDIGIHYVRSIRIESLFVDNSHSLSLIIGSDGGDVDVTLYGLDPDDINRMIATWGDPRRCDYIEQQAVYPEEMKKLTARVAELEAELAAATARGEREAV